MTSSLNILSRDPISSAQVRVGGELPKAVASGSRVWVLAGAHRGDNDQITILAEALKLGYRIDTDDQGIASILMDRVLGGRLTFRRRGSSALSGPPWPDLVLIAGGRRVGDALRIKRASGGHTRIVCVGRPWSDLRYFDLVVTTPQYCLPRRANVLQNTLTLNRTDNKALARAEQRWIKSFADLPRPWTAVLVGGKSGSYAFGSEVARRLAEEANAYRREHGGSLLVTTSPRTPAAATVTLRDTLDEPNVFRPWTPDLETNPYLGYLALADRFIITCDSASILSQACATGRPVHLFTYPARFTSRVLTKMQRSLLPYLHRMISAGLWFPARDMERFHLALHQQGLVENSTGGAKPINGAIPDDLGRTVRSIRALLPDCDLDGAAKWEKPTAQSAPIRPVPETSY